MAPKTKTAPPRIQIQDVWPIVDCGRYPSKRTLGETVEVWATIFKDGHDVLGASLRYRPASERRWRDAPMRPLGNDRWVGSFEVDRCGRWLEQKGKRDDPPVCTNSALASLIFPVDDVIETEGLPFQITFLFAGIVRCNRTATVRESVDGGTMEHPS